MPTHSLSVERKSFLLVLLSAFVVFFAQTKSFHLLFDGLTYSALAKNILKTGDWKTLHYGLEQYPNFYQHPPLAIWMQALVYKLFGTAEPVSRILSSSFAVLSVVAVYGFTRARFGLVAAFAASMTLITSTRFIKWGTNFYLDGILAFFCFASFALWVFTLSSDAEKISLKKSIFFSFVAGVLLCCAFMTKGVIASSTLAMSMFALLFYPSVANVRLLCFFALGLLAPVGLWVLTGDGLTYIHHYLQLSFAGRVQANSLTFAPWVNLFKVWWPWWPLFILGFAYACKRVLRNEPTALLMAGMAISFPVGFMFGISYLEHYLTPFYPFAAVVVGIQISLWVRGFGERAVNLGYAVLLAVSIFLATVSPDVNAQKPNAPNLWVEALHKLPANAQSQIQQIAFTGASFDMWYALAVVLAKTEWQGIATFEPRRNPIPHTVLIATANEKVSEKWLLQPCLFVEGFHFYAPVGENLCK